MPNVIEPTGFVYLMLKNTRKIFVLGMLIGGFGWITANALFMQTGHHPAPLFVPPETNSNEQNGRAITPPLPPTRPAEKMGDNEPAANKPITKPNIASAPQAQPATLAPAPKNNSKDDQGVTSKDPIGQFLTQQDEPNEARVKASQRALIKLGYVVRDNGVFGPATKNAIEAYQKHNGLAVTGTLTHALTQELSRQSGIAIP